MTTTTAISTWSPHHSGFAMKYYFSTRGLRSEFLHRRKRRLKQRYYAQARTCFAEHSRQRGGYEWRRIRGQKEPWACAKTFSAQVM